MAEEENEQEQDQAPETDAEQQSPTPSEIPPEVKKALRQANKEAETLRHKLKEFEDRDKSESQRATERLAAAESEVAGTRRELARYKVAAATGVPADLLTGDDEAAMTASSDALLAFRGETRTPPPASFGGGPRRTAETGTDMNQLIRVAAGHA